MNCLGPSTRPTLFSYLAGTPLNHGLGSSSTATEACEALAGSSNSLQGSVYFVTGASSPVARELCAALCLHGATVVCGHRRTEQEGDQLAAEIMQQAADLGKGGNQGNGAAKPAGEQTATPNSGSATQGQGPVKQQHGQQQADEQHPSASSTGGRQCTGQAIPLLCDLTSLRSARQCAEAFLALGLPLHCLVHCASLCVPDFSLSPDGYEAHFATNCLNPLLLTLMLLPTLAASAGHAGSDAAGLMQAPGVPSSAHPPEGGPREASGPSNSSASAQQVGLGPSQPGADGSGMSREGSAGTAAAGGAQRGPARVVWCTCSAHHIAYVQPRAARVNSAAWAVEGRAAARGYVASHAFGQSKLGVIFMARELAARAAAAGLPVASFAVHPGVTLEGLKKYGGVAQGSLLYSMKAAFAQGLGSMGALKSPAQAAATVAYAALAPSLVRDLAVTAAAPSPATPGPWEQGSSLPTSIPAGHGEGEDGDMPGSGPGQGKSKRAGSSTGAVPQQPHTAVLIRADEQGQAAAGGAYAYLEDCAESVPSYLARDPKAAAALWEWAEDVVAAFLGESRYGQGPLQANKPPRAAWEDGA